MFKDSLRRKLGCYFFINVYYKMLFFFKNEKKFLKLNLYIFFNENIYILNVIF